nr:hypothetical protein [uncultured Albidiferax sp.]
MTSAALKKRLRDAEARLNPPERPPSADTLRLIARANEILAANPGMDPKDAITQTLEEDV